MSTTTQYKSASKKEEDIALIITLLKNRYEDLLVEAKLSSQIHETGARTQLTSEIEKLIDNPTASMVSMRLSIDGTIKELIEKIFAALFSKNKEYLGEIFLSYETMTYFIELKEDNFENREYIFRILDFYESKIDFSNIIPVSFQFIPSGISEKLHSVRKIDF